MSNKVQLSDSAQSKLGNQGEIYKATSARHAGQPETGECVDYAAETEVSEKCVTAWRTSLKGDVPGAMKSLEDLGKKYPNMKTVSLMKGQIQDHAGNKELALKYYKAAVVGDEFDSIKLFKLAELERQTGKNSAAIADYHKLLAVAPGYPAAELGLAKTMIKENARSPEAKKFLQQVVASDSPESHKATVEAKTLLEQFETRKE